MSSRGPLDGPGRDRKHYTSPEYKELIGGPLDPLVHPDPLQPPRLYRWVRRVVRWLVLRLFRITVTGLENIPAPPYIIAANHQAWFDPAFIIPFFPEVPLIYTMAKRETVFNRAWKRRLLPMIGVFPISPLRGELDESGLRTVYQVLDRRGMVLMFPEGRYSRGRALRPLKVGIGHFALHAGGSHLSCRSPGDGRPANLQPDRRDHWPADSAGPPPLVGAESPRRDHRGERPGCVDHRPERAPTRVGL